MTDETSGYDADEARSDDACEGTDQIVAFFLGGQRYGLPIEVVQEIQQIVAFSEVPSAESVVTGMINLRGNVIPAVDARRLIGLPAQDYVLETPMIIIHAGEHQIALIVDEVQDVMDLPDGCMQAAPPMHALSSKMIGVARMADGLIYLLDMDLLMGPSVPGFGD